MKFLPGLLALIFLFSCSNNNQDTEKKDRPVNTRRDSNLVSVNLINPYAAVDVSPMDMSYFPEDFPKQHLDDHPAETLYARVIYSRPHRQGRTIFGNLLKYGEPWRLGANEATEIEFFKPATIQGKRIKAGRYIIYTIPQEDKWTLVLNLNLNSWGLNLNPAYDVARFEVPVTKVSRPLEYFTMVFKAATGGAELIMAWDTVEARLPIQF